MHLSIIFLFAESTARRLHRHRTSHRQKRRRRMRRKRHCHLQRSSAQSTRARRAVDSYCSTPLLASLLANIRYTARVHGQRRGVFPFVKITMTTPLNPNTAHAPLDRSVANMPTTGLGRTRSKCTAVDGGRVYRRSVPSAARVWMQCGASERCRHHESQRFVAIALT